MLKAELLPQECLPLDRGPVEQLPLRFPGGGIDAEQQLPAPASMGRNASRRGRSSQELPQEESVQEKDMGKPVHSRKEHNGLTFTSMALYKHRMTIAMHFAYH